MKKQLLLAGLIMALSTAAYADVDKANVDASNVTGENITKWQKQLGILSEDGAKAIKTAEDNIADAKKGVDYWQNKNDNELITLKNLKDKAKEEIGKVEEKLAEKKKDLDATFKQYNEAGEKYGIAQNVYNAAQKEYDALKAKGKTDADVEAKLAQAKNEVAEAKKGMDYWQTQNDANQILVKNTEAKLDNTKKDFDKQIAKASKDQKEIFNSLNNQGKELAKAEAELGKVKEDFSLADRKFVKDTVAQANAAQDKVNAKQAETNAELGAGVLSNAKVIDANKAEQKAMNDAFMEVNTRNTNMIMDNKEAAKANADKIAANKAAQDKVNAKQAETNAELGAGVLSNAKVIDANKAAQDKVNAKQVEKDAAQDKQIAANKEELNNKVDKVSKGLDQTNTRFDQNFVAANRRIDRVNKRVDKLETKVNRGLSLMAAMNAVDFQDLNEGDLAIGAGLGHYTNSQSVAVGVAFKPTQNMHLNAKYSVSTDDIKTSAVGVGVTYKVTNLF